MKRRFAVCAVACLTMLFGVIFVGSPTEATPSSLADQTRRIVGGSVAATGSTRWFVVLNKKRGDSYRRSDYNPAEMLCAGAVAGGVDSCDGDNGRPLITAGERPVLVGIISWGIGCGNPKYPGVYTRISTYAAWIQSDSGVSATP